MYLKARYKSRNCEDKMNKAIVSIVVIGVFKDDDFCCGNESDDIIF